MDKIFLIQDTSTGNWIAISLGESWDRTKEALFLRTASAAVMEGVGVSMGIRASLIESLNGLYSD